MFEKETVEDVAIEEHAGIVITKYSCKECNSVFCTTGSLRIENCVICGSPAISGVDSVEEKKLFVIPFQKSFDEAKKNYKKKVFWNPLVPIAFKRKKVINSIRGLYLPAFLANIDHSGSVHFLGGERETVVKNKEKMTETKKYDVNQTVHFDYNNVLLNVSTQVDDKIFGTICDYQYNNEKELNSDQMKDYCYIVGDIPISEVAEKGRERISKHSLGIIRGNVRHSLKKLKEDQTVIEFHNTKEVLVPVYLLNVSYRNKKYQYLMNGENGNHYIELPIGVVETIFLSLLVFGIIFLIGFLIAYFL